MNVYAACVRLRNHLFDRGVDVGAIDEDFLFAKSEWQLREIHSRLMDMTDDLEPY